MAGEAEGEEAAVVVAEVGEDGVVEVGAVAAGLLEGMGETERIRTGTRLVMGITTESADTTKRWQGLVGRHSICCPFCSV